MEIQDFKPKDPTDSPNTEGATAVKEAVAEEAPVADEVIVEEEPSLTVEGKTVTPTELAESLIELKDRAKAAGIQPLRAVVTSYASTILGAVDGLLGALEGKKKDK